MTNWRDYYNDERLTSRWGYIASILYHALFLFSIIRRHPKCTLEVGCGRGFHSIFLSYFVHSVIGIDTNKEVIALARQCNIRFHGKARFQLIDGHRIPFRDNSFDIVFSQGLLEHFSDKDMTNFVDEWLRLAPVCVVSVPSVEYGAREFGNERLLTTGEYQRIFTNYSVNFRSYGFRPVERGLSLSNILQSHRLLNPCSSRSQILLTIKRHLLRRSDLSLP
jgi:SAM-dependent methyltransferase